MNNKVFLHIGFGRCSTTTLQTNIFYKLAEIKNIKYIYGKSLRIKNNLEYIKNDLTKNEDYILYKKVIGKLEKESNDDILISDEGLISNKFKCPSSYQEKLEKNLKFFGSNAKIIITLRKPSDWLSSIYTQVSDGRPIKNFFLNKKNFENSFYKDKFLIENFNFEKIIQDYKNNFKNVYLIKYEDIKEFAFLKYLFNLNSNEINEIKKIYSKTHLRKDYNFYGYKINSFFRKSEKYLKFIKFLNKDRIIKNLERILPKKNIKINFNNLNIDIDELDDKYKKIDSIK